MCLGVLNLSICVDIYGTNPSTSIALQYTLSGDDSDLEPNNQLSPINQSDGRKIKKHGGF